ncbi:hypothetical protein [Flavobacterium geliluteum]|uniref:Uncharacterized protein n=1 Tax=Flavobacterium geliluteum TaxID=2816120 RepID=A0A941AWQ0_9FLAO|nr:hypothetical protein [Flavobacterium geliluteum]MBP4136946.1 hypothetical protein [Flavobacterium geliluteum]
MLITFTSGTLAPARGDEQKLLEEMSYAWTNKIIHIQLPPQSRTILGNSYNVTTTKYRFIFSDGTKIEFIQRSHELDPVTETLQTDHLSLMTIVKQYNP